MTHNEKILTAVAVGLAVAVSLSLGIGLGWPTWAGIVLVVGLSALTLLAGRRIQFGRQQRDLKSHYEQQALQAAPVPDPPRHTAVAGQILPSAMADYWFGFSGTVLWRLTSDGGFLPHADPVSLAVTAVLARARHVTQAWSLTDLTGAQQDLTATLGTALTDPSQQVLCWAVDISLTASPEDVARLTKLADLRKQQQLWEHERDFERDVRRYLADDVLKGTGSAVVWWLARHTDQVEETVGLIGALSELVAVANETAATEPFSHRTPGAGGHALPPTNGRPARPLAPHALGDRAPLPVHGAEPTGQDHVTRLVEEVIADPESPQRRLFGDQLARLVDSHGRSDLADHIRRRLGIPDRAVPGEAPAAAEGVLPVGPHQVPVTPLTDERSGPG
ncbi:MAG: hypothetical protein JOZ47_08795 [Kutzneria sp.]|nr:hypothetical protein [Kutzneria sp.]